jgi:hypothetical protein
MRARALAASERLSASVRFRAVTGRPLRQLPRLGCAKADITGARSVNSNLTDMRGASGLPRQRLQYRGDAFPRFQMSDKA